MPTDPTISIVISTRNRVACLERVLNALLIRQDARGVEFEVIVVDNGSTDRTADLVQQWRARFASRMRLLVEPRVGVSYGRNAGIGAARGSIIAFTDDDIEPSPTWIATLARIFNSDPSLELCGGRVLPRWTASAPVPGWLDRRHWSPLAIVDYGDEPFWTSARRPVCLLTANLAVRKSVFDRVGLFSADYPRCQDHEWLLRFWEGGGRGLYSPDLQVVGPVPAERLTRRYHREWHREHGRAAARMRLQERVGANGELITPAASTHLIGGAPPFVYREFAVTTAAWVRAVARRDRAGIFDAANHLRYLRAYVAGRTPHGITLTRRLTDAGLWLAARRRRRPTALSTRRLATVYAIMAIVFGASAYDIVTGREHWPFSPYPMFAHVDERPVVESIRLFGVTEGDRHEIPLLDDAVIAPFDQCRLSTALARAYSSPERRGTLPAMAADVLARYERRRAEAAFDGPPLSAVRAYLVRWHVTPDATNVDSPEMRTLVAEAARPAADLAR